jgi:hypothetical protein
MQLRFKRYNVGGATPVFRSDVCLIPTPEEDQSFTRAGMWENDIYGMSNEAVSAHEELAGFLQQWTFAMLHGGITCANADLGFVMTFERVVKEACQHALGYCQMADKFYGPDEVVDIVSTDTEIVVEPSSR